MRISKPEELRKIHLEISKKQDGGDGTHRQEKENMLRETVKRMIDLSNLARLEGLFIMLVEKGEVAGKWSKNTSWERNWLRNLLNKEVRWPDDLCNVGFTRML